MAETITQVNRPPEFIEAAAKPYLTELQQAVGQFKGQDLSQIMGSQFVAGQDPLQLQAQQAALAGIGGYQPYLQSAAASAGPTGYQQFMSPYQQDVIDATLADYDIQAQKGLGSIATQAIGAGAFGGGREGVQRAEYQSASDRNRAALQAQLLQQGFGQAQNLAQANIANQLQLGGAQQSFLGQDVGALSTLGGINQAQNQAQLSAQQQLLQAQSQQPIQAAQTLGSGIMGLISGYPGGTQQTVQPTPGALQTGLSAASTLAGIYKAFNPTPVNYNFGSNNE
jgi:hypothetical protein